MASEAMWDRGMKWLKELVIETSMRVVEGNLLVDEIEQLSRQVDSVERQLEGFSTTNLALQRLQTVPEVGLQTAEAIAAFLNPRTPFRRTAQGRTSSLSGREASRCC